MAHSFFKSIVSVQQTQDKAAF
jgi:hypothetical protein